MKYPYSLDKTSRKFKCPKCHEKRFVLYLNNATGEPLSGEVGRCDREDNCGYHFPPRFWFRENPGTTPVYDQNPKLNVRENEPHDVLPENYVAATMRRDLSKNNLYLYLKSEYGISDEVISNTFRRYGIGTSKRWDGATVFWQRDKVGQVRTGKIMLFGLPDGKRVKRNGVPLIDWTHSVLLREKRIKSFKLEQCLFGLHLLENDGRAVMLVESEKTAVVMSMLLPQYLWLSFGGEGNTKYILVPQLKGRRIIVFPDAGTYKKIKPKIDRIRESGYDIRLSDLVESNATEEQKKGGYDLQDYAKEHGWRTPPQTERGENLHIHILTEVLKY